MSPYTTKYGKSTKKLLTFVRSLVATPAGLEPVTSAVTGRRSNQLSYAAIATLFPRYVPPERVELSLSD